MTPGRRLLGGGFEGPIAGTGSVDWIAGLEMQGVKSYAKDSIDSRASATLREEGWLLPGLSLGAAAGGGKVTGSGWVGACKGEASWLSLKPGGFTMISAGIESEWDEEGRSRYQTGWLAWYRDQSLRTGRGFNYSASLSGFRSDPIIEKSTEGVVYVDDIHAASPRHYADSSYDSLLSDSKLTKSGLYKSHQDPRETSSRSPQSFLSFSPQAAYAAPLPGKLAAEISLSISGSWYPQAYRRDHAPLPADDGAAGDRSQVFRGLARSRADGREYAVIMETLDGAFRERFGAEPIQSEERIRLEGQGTVQATLRRAFGGWGTLALAAMAKRYASNLGNASPIWIPAWDAGISLQWNGAWEW